MVWFYQIISPYCNSCTQFYTTFSLGCISWDTLAFRKKQEWGDDPSDLRICKDCRRFSGLPDVWGATTPYAMATIRLI
jgi:hypothetical protein